MDGWNTTFLLGSSNSGSSSLNNFASVSSVQKWYFHPDFDEVDQKSLKSRHSGGHVEALESATSDWRENRNPDQFSYVTHMGFQE